jgi:hypothetical protein
MSFITTILQANKAFFATILARNEISASRLGRYPGNSHPLSSQPFRQTTVKPLATRPFRLGDGMILVAATAVAFAIFREGLSVQVAFATFGGNAEQWLFFWMHHVVPFPAMWSLAVFAIAVFDRSTVRRRKLRLAGNVACCAAVVVLALTSLIASAFYVLHTLEEIGAIPRIFNHARNAHAMPPFANAPMEELVGAAVLGAWSVMAMSGRWKCQRSWIDRTGRLLGIFWIGLFLIYLYAYTG